MTFFNDESSYTYIQKNKVEVVFEEFHVTDKVRYKNHMYTVVHRLPQQGDLVLAFKANFNYQYEAYEVFSCVKQNAKRATLAILPYKIVEFDIYEQECVTSFAVLEPIKTGIE